ncbi:MAG: sensor histidine kinase [Micromonosporaceae bacterium]
MDVRAVLRRYGLAVGGVVGTLAVVAAMGSMPLRGRPWWLVYELFMFHNGPSAVLLLWLGVVVLRRRPEHAAGLVLFAIGVLESLHITATAVLDARLVATGVDLAANVDAVVLPADLPLDAAVALLLVNTLWLPVVVLAATTLLLVFPDGRLPSRRWWPVPLVTGFGIAAVVAAFAITWWPTADWTPDDAPAVVGLLLVVGGLAILVAAAAGVAAMVLRWRRADASQQRQFQAVGFAAIGFAVVATALYPRQSLWIPAVLVAFHLLLATYALAVARYRLHDFEPVLGRAAVAAALAVGIAAVYAVIVVGIGSVVGRRLGGTVLPLVAVGVVALLVEPARRRVRRLVDRLLYRRVADRTQVMSRLAAAASTRLPESVLSEVTDLLVAGTGAERAEVWLAIDPTPQLAASSGVTDQATPALRADVIHHEERLGELRLYAWAAADLVRDAGELLDDVGHAVGVVLRNARLTAQLRAQLDELQRSRQRLVEAHDRARRGLERDIHDGAQSRLIALRLRIGLARTYADAGNEAALREQLDTLAVDVEAAVRSLRELARGLHPPILEQSGIVAALRSHARTLPLPVTVNSDGMERYERTVESVVYLCCLEALQNAVRHGNAAHISIDLAGDDHAVGFRVSDDGTGFHPGRPTEGTGLANINDRVSALGGQLSVDSTPGQGTTISGQVPAQPSASDR